jgi:hypothetical protein
VRTDGAEPLEAIRPIRPFVAQGLADAIGGQRGDIGEAGKLLRQLRIMHASSDNLAVAAHWARALL